MYALRRERSHMQRLQLVSHAVTHDDWSVDLPPQHCKRPGDCIALISTVGYATLGSGYHAVDLKPYSVQEAHHYGMNKLSLQQLLEADGEWNVQAQWRVDCTPLYRHHDHDDIHCGENAEHLNRMIIHAGFPQ